MASASLVVVRFRDRHITNILEIEQVGQELYRLLEEGKYKQLILDFSNVDYLSSALIGKMISLNAKAKARGGSVKLCSIRPEISEVFHTCKRDRIFSINKDVADAFPS
ncbi:MAG: STAS domain-containing protein [Thermoguttaceae bacterium]|jgi:anti-sigma B factor antagonist